MYEVGEAGPAAVLLNRAASGDEQAWRELVDLYTPVIWGVSRAYAGNTADAEDVCQATWLSLAENLERIRLRRARAREAPVGLDTDHLGATEHSEAAEKLALRVVSGTRLAQAFGALPQRCQQLLRVLAVAPETTYAQVSEALGIPRGTIGPKKSRCLAELRRRLVSADLPEEVAG
ncbi:sigma-70 family RNA polymerase sigma factor [Saccharopolyspora aridisoli]|uniref:Sigma-70 family RNA polymerase sigma factor n=1 Tax=Saccharopolyspora aridisoli TaxID=2530385 RepID=A0A4V2Y800_9PSEU|nr:sigma-70 family RNA polymerase sigma factor [Saccharopolyspora aridisoli]TDC94045.1 sigma-70 family RNA polymerase sigma factor [Saccharopolyspora aridisoli]